MAEAQLTNEGFVERTATEIKQNLVDNLTLQLPDFQEQDADIQDCLLDTAIIPIMEFEKLISLMLNCFSPDYANEALFLRFAESVGLRQKSAFNSQVMLRFTGAVGTIIPKNTQVTDSDGNNLFKTIDIATITTLGYVDILAYSEIEDIVAADTLTTLKSILADGISVTNPNQSLGFIDEESAEDLKARAQARFRSTRLGGRYYAESILKSVEGVNQRLVNFLVSTQTTEENGITYYINGIEAIVGGGDDYEVATALFRSFLETQKLISAPSDNDSERTINLDLHFYNNSVNVCFTRPKAINLGLKLYITFTESISTATSLESMTSDKILEYVDSLQVGTPITGWSLNNIVIPIFIENGVDSSIISTVKWAYKDLDGEAIEYTDFDSDNKVTLILKDCYAVLGEYSVEINA